ncbi:MAG TPA: M20/M25/M40 family metallo-hydrolase [Candidatus Aquilonibacter sp.]|nr:M20/M25/M40 family metallo-hydrolase [Candidatus Aquilonibacter sp.]
MARKIANLALQLALGTVLCALPLYGQGAQPPLAAPSMAGTPGTDLSQVESDAIGWLQGLVRINTSNPPGNEVVAAKYLAGILDKEGIHSEIFESAPGRGFLVARLSATAVPDPSRALLLMGHLDVVGVDRSKWTVDPFGGVIQGNYLYGRGSYDDKGMTAANLAVFIALKRANARLNRDVIFLAEGDEEAGGTLGMKFAVEQHWDKIASGYAINEGSRTVLQDGKVQYVGVQVSEKVSVNVDVIAKGTAGHASVPRADNPVVHLAAAIAKIGTYETPVQFNSVTRAYFDGIAAVEDEETGKWLRALESPDRGDHAARWVSSANPAWNAMLRDTISPTMFEAGVRQNVIPSEARAVLNIRLLPGNMIDPLLAKLQQVVNDPAVHFEVEPAAGEAAPSSSTDSDLYNSIARVARKEFSGAPAVPYMHTGATDSMYLRLRGVQAYGLQLFPMTAEDYARMHGDDERLPIDSFRKGVEFLYGVVSDFAVSK